MAIYRYPLMPLTFEIESTCSTNSIISLAKIKRDLKVLGAEAGMLRFNCMESILFNCPEYSDTVNYGTFNRTIRAKDAQNQNWSHVFLCKIEF